MAQERLEIRGACEHNLKDIDLKIPKKRLRIGRSSDPPQVCVFRTLSQDQLPLDLLKIQQPLPRERGESMSGALA
ncbi:hypothetical protein KJ940_12940, partial [Myxococcota bacterium]|nr:hypothetical protein [Myxococcota bacterium]